MELVRKRRICMSCKKCNINDNFFIVLVLVLLANLLGCCFGAALPEDYYPHVQILEIISSPTNRTNTVNLWKDRNTDIIIGEDTNAATSRILMKCNATYPVQWVYLGDGKPEFTTFTNVKWKGVEENANVPLSFEAEASLGLLGFQGVLREEDTGNYTCRSIQEPSVHSYYYIYVPGDALFSSPNSSTIIYMPQDQYVRIPCGVSHPKTSVTLCKKDSNDKLNCPVTGASGFNAKGGFLLNLKKQRSPSGTYVCTANFRGTVRMVEHVVMREDEKPKEPSPAPPPPTFETKPGGNLCDPSPCGKHAECSVVNGRAVCYCFRGLSGNPYDECAPGKCRSSKECPKGRFCRQGECTTDPCNPSPCGIGGECTLFRGQSKCSCQQGYTGLPPNCVKSCTHNEECSETEACIKSICQSPCPGPCGQHAECRAIINGSLRTTQCNCPDGWLGDPLKVCYRLNTTTPGPWNHCPPGYVGTPPACQRMECRNNIDCPLGQKCVKGICDKGTQPECPGQCGANAECVVSPTTSDPICVCPPGTTGNPSVQCYDPTAPPTSFISPSPSWGDPCNPNPCQAPAECHLVQGSRACVCPSGFTGDPSNCVPMTTVPAFPSSSSTAAHPFQCIHDGDCKNGENCISGRCEDMCNGICGYNAICEPAYQRSYRSIASRGKLLRATQPDLGCMCPHGYEGNPYVSCTPIRTAPPPPQSTMPVQPDPVCFPSPCAEMADCVPINGAAVCKCHPGFEGNPYQECRQSIFAPSPVDDRTTVPRPTQAHVSPVSPNELDYQGHSWGHHTHIGDTHSREHFPSSHQPPIHQEYDRAHASPPSERGFSSRQPPPPPTPQHTEPPYPPVQQTTQYADKPLIPSPHPSRIYDHDQGLVTVGFVPSSVYPTNGHALDTPTPKTLNPPMSPLSPVTPTRMFDQEQGSVTFGFLPSTLYPSNGQTADTPPPQTLNPPMSPMSPILPSNDDRDECTFKNPYADYDMDSCGVGHRCERDFHGVKKCVCISPFDCVGPTSVYAGNRCHTSRDCLLSEHVCVNETCRNPCSPEFSPCAGIAFAECRVIEGNVLCTCRRGYVGNPGSGLDCRPKRFVLPSGSIYPTNAKKYLIHGGHHNASSDFIINLSHFNRHNISRPRNNSMGDFDSSDSDSIINESGYEDDDIIISSGTSTPPGQGSTSLRHHRRHDTNHFTETDGTSKLGSCGFGSGHDCDEKSHCRVLNGTPMCVCKVGYHGKYPNCKPECEKNDDCPDTMACQYLQCIDPCIEEKLFCAENAFCRVINHSARCECDPGYVGVPWIQCRKVDSPESKDGCMGFNCQKRNARSMLRESTKIVNKTSN